MVTRLEAGSARLCKKVQKSQKQTQHSHQQMKEMVLSDKFCFIDLLCEISSMVVRLGMFFTIHVSADIVIIDRRNWMHDSAEPHIFFVASWPIRQRGSNSFLLLLLLSSHKHHLKWSFLESWCKRDLESVQEENLLLPYVHKCSAPSGQAGVVLHKPLSLLPTLEVLASSFLCVLVHQSDSGLGSMSRSSSSSMMSFIVQINFSRLSLNIQ